MAESRDTNIGTPEPSLPDYMTNPDAVLGDIEAVWRYGQPPDYSKTRQIFEKTKKCSHAPGSLPDLVQNLVKNWEIEASFKTQLKDWRTVDHESYSFAVNGGQPQNAEHMLNVGTYNALIAPNEWYSPAHSDFASSHKTFKRMMPAFAWEVLEVYSGPPVVAFKWRHWGEMKQDYQGRNALDQKVTAKAHNGIIDVEGITVAHLNEQMRITKLEIWFDPVEMFRQMIPPGGNAASTFHKSPPNASMAAVAGCPMFSPPAMMSSTSGLERRDTNTQGDASGGPISTASGDLGGSRDKAEEGLGTKVGSWFQFWRG